MMVKVGVYHVLLKSEVFRATPVKKVLFFVLASRQKITLPRIDNPAVNTGTFFPPPRALYILSDLTSYSQILCFSLFVHISGWWVDADKRMILFPGLFILLRSVLYKFSTSTSRHVDNFAA
jgi:hypothetical protein